ncbi:MAG TPA: hypothetical protein VGY97_08715, partial [Solirubrobacteraceae bacterium]|nr:hypothetical protein [Solirubrobacteraceae bacterium]
MVFVGSDGAAALRYGAPSVVDASGRHLSAELALRRRVLLLRAADRRARYPLVVDPFIQQGAKLTGGGATGPAGDAGSSVSLSSDGNTAIFGGPADNSFVGAGWVYTRSNGVWSQQGGKLVGTGTTGALTLFGASAGLSSDGNTAIFGGPFDNTQAGAGWAFTRSGGVWAQQQKLVGTGATGSALLGASAGLSSDGNTAIFGGPFDNTKAGAGWVFTRSGGVWAQQQKLVGTGATGATGEAGVSAGLSSDGNTAILGAPLDNGGVGAAWVFTRSGGVWTQQQKLVGTGATGATGQAGFSAGLSSDGNTAILGAPSDNSGVGAAWVFVRSGGVWTQQQKLVGGGETGTGQFGSVVGLSGDGNTAVVGGR